MNTTKTAQFTPGPLEMVFHSYGYEIKEVTKAHTATALRSVATIKPQGDRELHYANLFAAAPAMYEALQALLALIGDEDLPDNGELSGASICDFARSALAQAEGRHHE